MISIHLNGTFFSTREALKIMSEVNKGSIINMGSVLGTTGGPSSPHNSAAKAAILGFTRATARELASRNIRVNAIAPGYIDTDMTSSLGDVKKIVKSGTPMKKFGEVEDISWAAVYLASEEAKFWKVLSSKKFLDINRIKLDEKLLVNYYKNKGYYNISVESSSAKVIDLRGYINHFAITKLSQTLDKANLYSELYASENKTVYPLIIILMKAQFAFFRTYFLQKGFLNGWRGFVLAFSNSVGVFYKYIKIYAKHKTKKWKMA